MTPRQPPAPDALLFSASEWAEVREGFGLSLDIHPCRWMDVRELYQAELRWQLYKELPLWAADPDLGEHSNRMIFFELHDEPHAAYFAPQFPY